MYDRETGSLWHHLTGEPVVGPLVGSGIRLPVLPLIVTSWKEWRTLHPGTMVLDVRTGHRRDYRPGRAYGAYFASPDPMFPVGPRSDRYPAKTEMVALRVGESRKAYPLEVFWSSPVINDRVGGTPVVLLGTAGSRTVRAYERADHRFVAGPTPRVLRETVTGTEWRVEEERLVAAASGQALPRVGAHLVYWFSWHAFFPDARPSGPGASPPFASDR